ncbi:MAG: hypothetical protein AAF673_00460 [Pseudomonadota bacterium]
MKEKRNLSLLVEKFIDKNYKEELLILDDVIAKIDCFSKELKINRKVIESRYGLYRKTEHINEILWSIIGNVENLQLMMKDHDREISKAQKSN